MTGAGALTLSVRLVVAVFLFLFLFSSFPSSFCFVDDGLLARAEGAKAGESAYQVSDCSKSSLLALNLAGKRKGFSLSSMQGVDVVTQGP